LIIDLASGEVEEVMMKNKFLKSESGAGAAEYALLIGLIATVIIAAVTQLGTSLSSIFNSMASKL
jgi:pilus assembly protein Flp/PilA